MLWRQHTGLMLSRSGHVAKASASSRLLRTLAPFAQTQREPTRRTRASCAQSDSHPPSDFVCHASDGGGKPADRMPLLLLMRAL
eukprot:310849-Pleurochrysis_carterae.AAC.3